MHQHEKPSQGNSRAKTREDLTAGVSEAMKSNPDPYEVAREKPGYTETRGSTLILGDEASRGLRLGLSGLGKGRAGFSRKEVADEGQTAAGFKEIIKKRLGFTIKAYANAIIQIGRHDIEKTERPASEIYKDLMEIWKLCDAYQMKVIACTIPPFGGTTEQEKRRQELNRMIMETDEPLHRVIHLEEKVKDLVTDGEPVYVDGKLRREPPQTEKDRVAVAYLEAMMGTSRESLKASEDEHFVGKPKDIAFATIGTPVITPSAEEVKQDEAGKPAVRELETQVIPTLTKRPGYRCAVIHAQATDLMRPIRSGSEANKIEETMIRNLKQMYRKCLESNPPVMVVAVTLPPMDDYFEKQFEGEERELHKQLWRNINEFIMKETRRLSLHPKDRYKRIMCVRAHELVGTRLGRIQGKYRTETGSLNPAADRKITSKIYEAMKQMREGIAYGRNIFIRPKKGPDGKRVHDEKGRGIMESYFNPDYFLDEHDYQPADGRTT